MTMYESNSKDITPIVIPTVICNVDAAHSAHTNDMIKINVKGYKTLSIGQVICSSANFVRLWIRNADVEPNETIASLSRSTNPQTVDITNYNTIVIFATFGQPTGSGGGITLNNIEIS